MLRDDSDRPLSRDDYPPVGSHVRAVVLGATDHNRQIRLSMRPSSLEPALPEGPLNGHLVRPAGGGMTRSICNSNADLSSRDSVGGEQNATPQDGHDLVLRRRLIQPTSANGLGAAPDAGERQGQLLLGTSDC